MTAKPLVSVPVPAVVGTATSGPAGASPAGSCASASSGRSFAACRAIALAASIGEPPPTATITERPNKRGAAERASTSAAHGLAPTPSWTAVRTPAASSRPATTPATPASTSPRSVITKAASSPRLRTSSGRASTAPSPSTISGRGGIRRAASTAMGPSEAQWRSRQILVVAHHGHLAGAGAVALQHRGVEVVGPRRHLGRDPGVVCELERHLKVLCHQAEWEALSVLPVLEHLERLVLEERGPRGAGGEGGVQRAQVDPGARADHERLGGGGGVDEPLQVDEKLHRVTGPWRPDVHDALGAAHGLEHRARAGDVRGLAADEDVQIALARLQRIGHRRVEERDVARCG